jgi:adenylyltransferase/sulfurtransferase
MEMSLQANEFFARQIAIPSVGTSGLASIRLSTVAIVGAGGAGSAAAYYLSKLGIGNLRIIDQDIVETTNLNRLHGAEIEDLYQPKAEVLARRLSRPVPWCRIEAVVETITGRNTDTLLEGAHLVLDGLDNFRTRYVINRFCSRTRTPYVFASSVSDQAHVALFTPPKTPCLECVMPNVVDRTEESCEALGVTPTITGLVGAITANITVRHLLHLSTKLSGKLLTIDMAGPDFLITGLARRTDCSSCNLSNSSTPQAQEDVTLLCGEHTANVIPRSELDLDLQAVSMKMRPRDILAQTNSVIVFRKDTYTVSLFRNGRTLISGVAGEQQALEMAREIWKEAMGNEHTHRSELKRGPERNRLV